MKKKIVILGSTGSIGKTLINILKNDKDKSEHAEENKRGGVYSREEDRQAEGYVGRQPQPLECHVTPMTNGLSAATQYFQQRYGL